MPLIQESQATGDKPKVKIFVPKVAPPPEPAGRDKNHTAFRTIQKDFNAVEVEFVYDLDPKDPEGSAKRKEAAFEAALKVQFPAGLKKLRSGAWHYKSL